jgi:molybdopterin converting factor small subunit
MVACDMNYADWETPVVGVREIAFLPPFSGG